MELWLADDSRFVVGEVPSPSSAGLYAYVMRSVKIYSFSFTFWKVLFCSIFTCRCDRWISEWLNGCTCWKADCVAWRLVWRWIPSNKTTLNGWQELWQARSDTVKYLRRLPLIRMALSIIGCFTGEKSLYVKVYCSNQSIEVFNLKFWCRNYFYLETMLLKCWQMGNTPGDSNVDILGLLSCYLNS